MQYSNYQNDETYLRQLLKQSPDDMNIKIKLVKILLNDSKNIEEAKQLLQELLDTRFRKFAMLELGKLESKCDNIKAAKYYLTNLLNSKNNLEALIELGKLEKKNDNLEKAIEYFSLIIDNQVNKDKYKQEFYTLVALLQLIFIEIHRENYEKAYLTFNKLLEYNWIQSISSKTIFQIDFYLKYKLNKLTKAKLNINSYFTKQLLSYDKEKTINHIKLHLNKSSIKKEHTLFLPSLDLNWLYEKVRYDIYNAGPQNYSLCDKYFLDFNFTIGKIENNDTNRIKVITFSNTKSILTMYPITNKTYEYDEENYEKSLLKKYK